MIWLKNFFSESKAAITINAQIRQIDPHFSPSSSSYNSSEHPLQCLYCSVIVPDRAIYQKHLLHYHPECNSFPCGFCLKSFKNKYSLRSHMINHRERRFGCVLCDSRFKLKHHLKKHMKCVHKMFQCGRCMANFLDAEELTCHMQFCSGTVWTKSKETCLIYSF